MGPPGAFDNTIDWSAFPAGQTIYFELNDMSMADGSILAIAVVEILLN